MDSIQTQPTLPTHRGFPWRLFWLLALMSLIASLLGLPYATQLLRAGQGTTVNGPVFRIATTVSVVLQAVMLYWPMALLGLYFARRLQMGAPVLSAWLHTIPPGEDARAGILFRRILRPALIVGFGGGILILLAAGLLSPFYLQELNRQNAVMPPASTLPNAWQGLLGSISAGINEEIFLRLFLLSLIAWIIQRALLRQPDGRPSLGVFWAANVLSALVFGLLHLPNLVALKIPLSPFMVLYTVVLNNLIGMAFGWLYWTFGLESAMMAHFFTDLVLHVLPVWLQGFKP